VNACLSTLSPPPPLHPPSTPSTPSRLLLLLLQLLVSLLILNDQTTNVFLAYFTCTLTPSRPMQTVASNDASLLPFVITITSPLVSKDRMAQHSLIHEPKDLLHMITPSHGRKSSRPDAHFPLSAPRSHRAPSTGKNVLGSQAQSNPTTQTLSVRGRIASYRDYEHAETAYETTCNPSLMASAPSIRKKPSDRPRKTVSNLPLEIQGLILDYLFGDIHAVTSSSTSLLSGANCLSSAMRHPRRRALTDVALVSRTWRELVQERIYRHSKT
jgi:hypothetical protein